MTSHDNPSYAATPQTHTVIALDHRSVTIRPVAGGQSVTVARELIPLAYLNAPLSAYDNGYSVIGTPPTIEPVVIQQLVESALSMFEGLGIERSAARAMFQAALTCETSY